MSIDEIRKNAPDGATHYWSNEWGCAYYYFCKNIKRWIFYDKHHDYWYSQNDSIAKNLKPL